MRVTASQATGDSGCFITQIAQFNGIWDIGPGNGLVPKSTKPLPEPMLTYNQ